MLALSFSLLLSLYLIAPEAIFRFFFGIHVPTRSFILTTTETVYRAVLVAFFPFWFALALCWWSPIIRTYPFPVEQNTIQERRADYRIVGAALYSDAEFSRNKDSFWPALSRTGRRQARLSIWYFILVGFEGYYLGKLASRYAKYKDNKFYSWWSDRIQSPYISQWHPLLLTSHLLPKTVVQADILCTNDLLYQGNVSEYFLKEGQLTGIILKDPRRFNRDQYHQKKESYLANPEGPKPEKKDFWIQIPSQHLYFFADKILNMNLTYVTETISSNAAVEQFLADILSGLTKELGKLTVSVTPSPTPKDTKKL